MAIIRVPKVNNYTVMSNHHLLNPALSLKAKGLMSYMLSRPDDWDFTIDGLARLKGPVWLRVKTTEHPTSTSALDEAPGRRGGPAAQTALLQGTGKVDRAWSGLA